MYESHPVDEVETALREDVAKSESRSEGTGRLAEAKSIAHILEIGRYEAQMTQLELWLAYRDLGGRQSLPTVEEYLRGRREPKVTQYNLLAQAINDKLDALTEGGEGPHLPLVRLAVGVVDSESWVAGESNPEPTD